LTPCKHENKNDAENLRSTESFRLRQKPLFATWVSNRRFASDYFAFGVFAFIGGSHLNIYDNSQNFFIAQA
jgi:hypothetical protein